MDAELGDFEATYAYVLQKQGPTYFTDYIRQLLVRLREGDDGGAREELRQILDPIRAKLTRL